MQIDWWTLALQAINALVLIWLLERFLFRPVARIISERRSESDRLLADAKAAKDAAETELARARQEAEAQAALRAEAVSRAEADAAARRRTLLAEAQAEAARIASAAETDTERTRQAADERIADSGAELAVDIATRLFGRLPPEAQIGGFIAGFTDALAKLPAEVRDQIAPLQQPIRLRAPRALRTEESDRCRAAISEALGRDVELDIDVDPGVIAGLEAECPLGSVRNSFRADLETIARALKRHDAAE